MDQILVLVPFQRQNMSVAIPYFKKVRIWKGISLPRKSRKEKKTIAMKFASFLLITKLSVFKGNNL